MNLDQLSKLPPAAPASGTVLPQTQSSAPSSVLPRGTMTLDQLSAATAPPKQIIPQVGPHDDLANRQAQISNPLGKGLVAFGQAAKETTGALTGNTGTDADYVNPVGWATKALGFGINTVANKIKSVVDPVSRGIGSAARYLVGGDNADKIGNAALDVVAGQPGSPMRNIASNLVKTYTDPNTIEGLNAVGQTANLAGTVVGAKETAEAMAPLGKTVIPKIADNYINSEKASWAKPTETPQKIFSKPAEIFDNAKANGHDIPDTLVKNKIKLSENVQDGKYATADSADQIRSEAGKASREMLRPSLQMADYTTPKTPVADIVKSTIDDIKGGRNVTSGDMESQIAKARAEGEALARKYPEGMSLTDMHDEKINYNSNRYSPVGPKSDANAAEADRAYGRTLAKTVETKAPPDVPVKQFNAELQKQYQAADYLDALDSKKVPQGFLSKIAKTTAKVAGAAVGERLGGGIMSTVGGYHLGGMLESAIENMSDPIKAHFLDNLQRTNPEAFNAVRDYLGTERTSQLTRKALPPASNQTPIPMGGRTGETKLFPSASINPATYTKVPTEAETLAAQKAEVLKMRQFPRSTLDLSDNGESLDLRNIGKGKSKPVTDIFPKKR